MFAVLLGIKTMSRITACSAKLSGDKFARIHISVRIITAKKRGYARNERRRHTRSVKLSVTVIGERAEHRFAGSINFVFYGVISRNVPVRERRLHAERVYAHNAHNVRKRRGIRRHCRI